MNSRWLNLDSHFLHISEEQEVKYFQDLYFEEI